MAERLKTFAPNQVVVIITHEPTGIVHQLTGFSEDSIVQIARNAETFTLYRGADDTKTRIFNSDTSAQLTIPLQQTSNSNDILTFLYDYDRARLNDQGLFQVMVKDLSGRSNYFSDESYIGNVPDSNFANTMQLREWVIHCASLNTMIGGNSRFSESDAAAVVALDGTIAPQWLP